jgi:hypothetical protein
MQLFLLPLTLLKLIYQQLSRSRMTDAICLFTDSEFLMVDDHPNQACEATTAAGKFFI